MKNYDLSFMNEYIKLKKISIYDLVIISCVDAYKIKNYFKGLEVPPQSFLSMLYKYMEVNNYDELYNKVTKEIEKIKDENKVTSGFEKIYNIGFLSNKNIDIEYLSVYCNISKEDLTNYITGKKLTPIIIVNKICEYFKVNNINDLKKLEEKENNEINTFHDKRRIVNEFSLKKTKDEDNIEIIEKSLNTVEVNNYLKRYISIKGIKIVDIATITGISTSQISKTFNEKYITDEKYLKEILRALNIKNYDELKKTVDNLIDSKEFISYLKLYIKNKNITLKDISDGINISYSYFSDILNGRRALTETYINKILEFLNLKDYDELKKKSGDSKKIIKYLKQYMKKEKITLEEFAKGININCSYLCGMLNGRYNFNEIYINKILEYLNIDNLNELKYLANIPKNFKEFTKYLRMYIKIKKISLEELANGICINYTYLISMLNGKYVLKEQYMNDILEFLNVKSFDEMKNIVDNFIPDKSNDINFLNDYLSYLSIDQKELSDYIGCSRAILNYALNGRQTLNDNMMSKLLEYFNVEGINELKDIVKEKNKIDLKFLKFYLEYEGITLEELSKKIDCSYKNLKLMINDKNKIKKIYYDKILNYFNASNYNDLLNKLKYETEEDLTFIKPFLILNGITQNEFAKILNCGITNANKALNGVVKLQPMYIKNLLEYFNFKDFKSFKDYVLLILNKNNVNIVDYAAISLIFTHNYVNKMMDKLSKELNISYDLLKYKYEKYKLMYIQSINSKNNDFNIPLYKLNH